MSRLRIRHGDNEIEVDGAGDFILKQLKAFYARIDSAPPNRPNIREKLLEGTPGKPGGKVPTPAEFYKTNPRTDGVSRILIFGKYLEKYRNKTEFSRQDINDVAAEAKLSKDIHAQYFTNAVKQGLLRKHGKSYSLTLSAEEVLASM